jgi:hypothetical protein
MYIHKAFIIYKHTYILNTYRGKLCMWKGARQERACQQLAEAPTPSRSGTPHKSLRSLVC